LYCSSVVAAGERANDLKSFRLATSLYCLCFVHSHEDTNHIINRPVLCRSHRSFFLFSLDLAVGFGRHSRSRATTVRRRRRMMNAIDRPGWQTVSEQARSAIRPCRPVACQCSGRPQPSCLAAVCSQDRMLSTPTDDSSRSAWHKRHLENLLAVCAIWREVCGWPFADTNCNARPADVTRPQNRQRHDQQASSRAGQKQTQWQPISFSNSRLSCRFCHPKIIMHEHIRVLTFL
jgi:hypothetical protein